MSADKNLRPALLGVHLPIPRLEVCSVRDSGTLNLCWPQDLPGIGEVSVAFDPFTPSPVENVTVTVARDASTAFVSSSTDLRNFLAPGTIIRIGGADVAADGTLTGSNGEGFLDYPGGVGHRYD